MLENNENRGKSRDSMFLLADVNVEGVDAPINVRVRNLSAGGMMAEAAISDLIRGSALKVNLRNIGEVPGTIAWTKHGAFGISFDNPIDPKLARKPVGVKSDENITPRYIRPISTKGRAGLS